MTSSPASASANRQGRAGVVPLHPGLRAYGAQGTRGTCGLAVKLPPLGGRPRGSRVWQGDALHPTPRPLGVGLFERHAAWPGFYRRGTTGATARRSGVVSHQLASIDRHSATGLMVRNQNPACFQNRLDFFVTKQPKPCRSLSPHAISAPLPPKRRRSSAAIGSGGKKARSF